MDVVAKLMPAPVARRYDLLLVHDQRWDGPDRAAVAGRALLRGLLDAGITAAATSPCPLTAGAPAWLRHAAADWATPSPDDVRALVRHWAGPLMPLRLAVAGGQGLSLRMLAGLGPVVGQLQPRAVVGLGANAPLLLAASGRGPVRLWLDGGEGSAGARERLIHVLQRAATRRHVHGIARLVRRRWTRHVPLAVGLEDLPMRPLRAVMPPVAITWGEPEDTAWVRGLARFVARAWPTLRARQPRAALLVGCDRPTSALKAALAGPGVSLGPRTAALRAARGGAVAIFPARGGMAASPALLEAAALGLPIVTAPAPAATLAAGERSPVRRAGRPSEAWIEAVWRCWSDPAEAMALSQAARRHVERHHQPAQMAAAALEQLNRLLPAGEAIVAAPRVQRTGVPAVAARRLAA